MQGFTFDINVPLASWATGGHAVVPTDQQPTWSAIVGMMGAALGLPRGDERLVRLSADYALALVDKGGRGVLTDFHTVQSPKESPELKDANPHTRREELESGEVEPSITRRDYLCGASYQIFIVQVAEHPVFAPAEIQAAMVNPVYPLSAGRRSCLIGRVQARPFDAQMLDRCTHWDARIPLDKPSSLVRERRDQLIGPRRFGVRMEHVA